MLLLFFCCSVSLFAQKSAIYNNESQDFKKGLSLFHAKQFLAAQIIFEKLQSHSQNTTTIADCTYYAATCAMHLQQPHADLLMENFIEDYPTNANQNKAFFEVASYYFQQNNFVKSLEWFQKMDESQLDQKERDQLYFQKGYAFFITKDKIQANNYLNKVVHSNQYGAQAKYYLGYMAYQNDDFKEANKQFETIANDLDFKEKLSYFQADMNFKLGKFDQAIALGKAALAKSSPTEQSELHKIIGESYFNLQQYDKAWPYLEKYKGKNGKWNNTDFYQLGYAFYQQKDYEKAILQFNKIIDGQDGVAQNAYYHLAESYWKTNQQHQAFMAFKSAADMNFDIKIKEDAALNYAKLSYELGNPYENVSTLLQKFISQYPKNPETPTVQKLLINSYLSSKNYKEALELLEKTSLPENKTIFQKVAFYRGLELVSENNYAAALPWFEKAINTPRDLIFTTRATFWKAESAFQLDRFALALQDFKDFQNNASAKNVVEYIHLTYHLGYCHFKLKQFALAATQFQAYINTPNADKLKVTDSHLRLADALFMTAQYQLAIESYNKVIELQSVEADYASFQKAICFGFISKNTQKIEYLTHFLKKYPQSTLRASALFEMANTYLTINKPALAIKTYDQLLLEFPNSVLYPKALFKKGLALYNQDQEDEALAQFKKLVAQFPNAPESLDAVATARLIYLDKNQVDVYANWVKTLPFIAVSNADLDHDSYQVAEKQYLQNNVKAAIAGFEKYLSSFPEGFHALNAHFYLGQLYFNQAAQAKAAVHYEAVCSGSQNEFSEEALFKLSQIYLTNNQHQKSIPTLIRLEKETNTVPYLIFAQSHLMQEYYENKDFANAVVYAEKVLANSKISTADKTNAQVFIARAAFQNQEESKAKQYYAKLQPTAKGELGAEALYYEAYFKNKEGLFELSNKAIQKLSKDFSGYKYFAAKGLIVMAKNYHGLKDAFQATYILEAVLQNFKQFDDVMLEAKQILEIVKLDAGQINSSIQK